MEVVARRATALSFARLEPAGVWLYSFLVVVLVAAHAGGFQPTTWGWCAVLTLWLAAIALLVRDRVEHGRLELLFVGGLVAFTAWVALSNLWTSSMTSTMHEVQRDLAYLGVVAAGLVLTRRRTSHALLGGILAGIVLLSLYALGTRILPDRLGAFDSQTFGYRLATPITYWNGLGIFTVVGILLALGFAVRGKALATRGAAAAALPLLTVTMYFTFSRGAWVALGVGLVATVAADTRRLQFLGAGLLLAPWSAAALFAAHDRKALTTIGATLERATHQGHSLVAPLAVLAVGSAATAVGFAVAERRMAVPRGVRVAFAASVVVAVALGVGVVWVDHGSPWQLANRAWDSFKSPAKNTGADLSNRLFQLTSNGRVDLWGTSWESFRRHPLIGNGAGTFWQLWAAKPDRSGETTQGHSLYAQTLGELGSVGLALLLFALATPLAALVRARRTALGVPAFGAYAAWLAHASIDWDWELVGVSAPALLCAVALIASGRHQGVREVPARALRIVGAATCAIALAATVPSLLADQAVDRGRNALPAGGRQALKDAANADRWAPWSSEPAELRGDAWRSLGELQASRSAYLRALGREPANWQLWAKLADVSDGRARTAALERANALNPMVVVTAIKKPGAP